ncbi:MAG: hypothetical protein RL291_1461 [Pseudomonadota bacterium]
MKRRDALFGLSALPFLRAAAFAQSAPKPRVPVGNDPGGVRVAVIGGGIDYTRPEFKDRLARDGEGTLTGVDFEGKDLVPFEPEAEKFSTRVALDLVARARSATIVPVRVGPPLHPPYEAKTTGHFITGLAAASTMGARVAILAPSVARPATTTDSVYYAALRGAAKHDHDRLLETRAASGGTGQAPTDRMIVILPVGDDGRDVFESSIDKPSQRVLVVTAAGQDGQLLASSNFSREIVDLAVTVPNTKAPDALPPSVRAAVALAARAVTMLDKAPTMKAPDLVGALAALALPLSSAAQATRYGVVRID